MKTILFVEDEPILLELISESIADEGFKVLAAQNGNEALQYIEKEAQIDILITDLNVPGTKGDVIAVKFRKKFTKSPICILSGHLDAESTIQFEIPISPIVFKSKPTPQKDLLEWLAQFK